jgi:hypothetical protein
MPAILRGVEFGDPEAGGEGRGCLAGVDFKENEVMKEAS